MNLEKFSKKQIVLVSAVLFTIFLFVTFLFVGFVLFYFNLTTNSYSVNNSSEIGFERDLAQVDDADLRNHSDLLNIDQDVELSSEEIEDLLFMREEEKLARDVYIKLYEKWDLSIFNNISNSEQRHTDSLETLINAYGLKDPYQEGVGTYTNNDLEELYNDLVLQGSKSIEDALKVGALIEDLDIVDLEEAISRTDNSSILTVYENLQRGSRNHLRSFTATLSRYGDSYDPQYLSIEEYQEIITGAHEKGNQSSGLGGRNRRN